MSMDPNVPEPYAPQTPPGEGGGSSVWLFLGVGCGLMFLLCCGGGVALFFTVKNAFEVTQDAAAVAAKAGEIADFDAPRDFTPQMAMSMNVPFAGTPLVKMVAYGAPDEKGGLFLFEFGTLLDPEQLRLQMENSMDPRGPRRKPLRVLETRELEVEIRNQPASFQIQKAEDPQSKQQYVQVEGTFQGKQGPAMLAAQLNADDFSEEDAEKLVRSIK